MTLNPYLSFNGNCESAFKFYEKAIGGKIKLMMTYGDSPMCESTPPEWRSKIMHARMEVDGQILMGADSPDGRYEAPKGTWVTLGIEKAEDAERVFAALGEGATIVMPIQETFWAHRFGMLIDQFGTPWMVNCEKPM